MVAQDLECGTLAGKSDREPKFGIVSFPEVQGLPKQRRTALGMSCVRWSRRQALENLSLPLESQWLLSRPMDLEVS